jgi:Spy/CpxP family protein refolding chaperone
MDKSWRVIFAFIGIFIAGAVSGLLLAPRVFKNVAERGGQGGPGRPPIMAQQLGPQLFRRLTERLNLTAEQREKIKPIELRTTEELRRLQRESRHETELALERMQDEVSAILTPDQRTQFEEQIARSREKIKKFIQEKEGRGRREPLLPNRQREGAPPK